MRGWSVIKIEVKWVAVSHRGGNVRGVKQPEGNKGAGAGCERKERGKWAGYNRLLSKC